MREDQSVHRRAESLVGQMGRRSVAQSAPMKEAKSAAEMVQMSVVLKAWN